MVRASDILVVGAGIIGCAVACELARRGASVTVVDEREAGAGATQASGGMLAPFSEASDAPALLDLGARSLALFDRFVESAEADSGARVGYARSGTLHVARRQESLRELEEIHRILALRGVAAETLSAADTRAREPLLSVDLAGGLLIPAQGLVSALDLTRALAHAAVRFGATFVDRVRVHRIAASGSGVAIETDRGSVSARVAVLAAGAWSGRVLVEGAVDPLPVKPVRGQLLQLGWCGTPIARVTWDERCYAVPRSDGTLLVGATVEDVGFDERTTVGGIRSLMASVCDLLPQAANASLLAARVGFRPAGPDPLPIVGWSGVIPGLMYATGHFRNGVLLAPLTAAIVADAILAGRQDEALELMRPSRFGRV